MWFIPSWNFESSGRATDNNQVNRQIHACKSCMSVRSNRTGNSDRELEKGSILIEWSEKRWHLR